MKIQRRQFLQSTALIGAGLLCNFSIGDRSEKQPSTTIADEEQANAFLRISPSGEFFFYSLSAACAT